MYWLHSKRYLCQKTDPSWKKEEVAGFPWVSEDLSVHMISTVILIDETITYCNYKDLYWFKQFCFGLSLLFFSEIFLYQLDLTLKSHLLLDQGWLRSHRTQKNDLRASNHKPLRIITYSILLTCNLLLLNVALINFAWIFTVLPCSESRLKKNLATTKNGIIENRQKKCGGNASFCGSFLLSF